MKFKRLKDLREDNDIKQQQIAALLKTTQQQYSRYETGVQEIPVRHLITLAEFYHTTVDYIVGLSDIRERQESL
ncbi:MAG: helix-turn-helix transcriptional regulator [Erysipelotrichaceae bacterium]|jgi:transcriptional regulator with XRE-family HTH domain|nr:helix-turn-helix transcriptional regulator [Erysipelotrichaceae bacterium]MCI9523839.1 helix-turn-helix transcriptional regulator [Erysipelotrichaceae bacterium]